MITVGISRGGISSHRRTGCAQDVLFDSPVLDPYTTPYANDKLRSIDFYEGEKLSTWE